jgi:hypothetical protein
MPEAETSARAAAGFADSSDLAAVVGDEEFVPWIVRPML